MERKTQQRDAIRRAVESAGRPLSPREILALARRRAKSIGMATVYRNIRAFVSEGVLTPVSLPGEAQRYEMAGKAHHHHFYCRKCDRVFEMDGCPDEIHRLAPKGFRVDGHEVTLFGQCIACGRR